MSFVIQRVTGRQISLSEVRTAVLRIGRGTNAELRSDNPAVALEHATIESDAAGYSVTDKGSITGTYVNGKPVETARLAKGDVIEVGDLRIEVQVAEANKPLFVRLVSKPKPAAVVEDEDEEEEEAIPAAAAASGRAVRAPKLDYADAFRLRRVWFTKLSLVALGLIVSLVVIAEVTRPEKQSAFRPGGVSSAHARARGKDGQAISNDCAACHNPWNSVKDERCMACHQRAAHAENEKDPLTCMSCHNEHRGLPKLALVNDQKCASCHADLTPHVKVALAGGSAIRSITEFGKDHPELVSLADPNNIRFNHKLHLRKGGIFNATGRREELKCVGCHKLAVTRGKADPVRLEFEEHCQRCHKLTFDARFPKEELPHGGNPQIVYGYIVNIYSGNLDIVGKSAAERGRLLARGDAVTPSARAVINARQVVKSKCAKCHDLQQRNGRDVVDPPKIVTDWMPGSRFTHTEHSGLDCESCHKELRNSVNTADVHMPKKADCTSCHGAGTTAASSCLTCHEYHVRSKPLLAAAALPIAGGTPGTSGGEPRMIDQIVLITITVLILVVLVPVGIALFQRLTRKADDRPAAPAAPRPAPPPLPKAPPMPAQAPPPPAAPPARAPEPPPMAASFSVPPDSTKIASLPEAQPGGASGSTDFMEWYGMIVCSSGPNEGQRVIIEGDGVYIGRDKKMAEVVVNDSRVSKRHVRIVPRGGKVWAIDQGSTNGTFVGGQRITEVQLKKGDAIVLADNAATFLYQV
jgi:pSer/pThr/pTyr-binding forkhead associated (FHA) protein